MTRFIVSMYCCVFVLAFLSSCTKEEKKALSWEEERLSTRKAGDPKPMLQFYQTGEYVWCATGSVQNCFPAVVVEAERIKGIKKVVDVVLQGDPANSILAFLDEEALLKDYIDAIYVDAVINEEAEVHANYAENSQDFCVFKFTNLHSNEQIAYQLTLN